MDISRSNGVNANYSEYVSSVILQNDKGFTSVRVKLYRCELGLRGH
jgi:hypothetical protein